jgi:hypothetical protein
MLSNAKCYWKRKLLKKSLNEKFSLSDYIINDGEKK